MEPIQLRFRLIQPDDTADTPQPESIDRASATNSKDWSWPRMWILGSVRMKQPGRRVAIRQAWVAVTNDLLVRGFQRGIDLAQEVGRTPLRSHLSRAVRVFGVRTGQSLPERMMTREDHRIPASRLAVLDRTATG